ncbi:MAG TPA: 4'-phosphopantetheinyl transferase superfamily protein [Herbaspirillum sp.]|jgi:enterobactin synthetase component D
MSTIQETDSDSAWWRGGLKAALALPASVYLAGGDAAVVTADIIANSSTSLPLPLGKASPKRKTDYLAGRHYAVAALRAAGCEDATPPAMGEDRLPQWPAGWLGSITHSNGEAMAAVGNAGVTRLLGIDVETLIDPASVDGIAALVALEGELALFEDHTPSQALTLLFSAKESLYKALYPDTRRFMDFSAARILALDAGSLILSLTEDWHPAWPAGRVLPIRYAVRRDRVYTALHLAS